VELGFFGSRRRSTPLTGLVRRPYSRQARRVIPLRMVSCLFLVRAPLVSEARHVSTICGVIASSRTPPKNGMRRRSTVLR
jgi:hypothetical protein